MLFNAQSHKRLCASACLKTFCLFNNGVAGAEPPYRSSAICATASCSGFVWLTASILAWSRGGSPSNIAPARMPGVYARGSARCRANQAYTAFHRGKGLSARTPKYGHTKLCTKQSQQSVLKGIGIEDKHFL